ncbi:protein draper-like [Haliotis rufescens]|uniref:protein draper-like n=1 Tax=Haliotis rufescens TaxID=6454 RepID=UPI00201EB14C|nr:protein draper-like [Haliotis rufescens]
MAWYSFWRYCMVLFAPFHDLLGNCTATNITTTEPVPAITYLPGYLEKICPLRCLEGKCTFLDDGGIDCTYGCNDGYMGKMCNFPCMNNCSKCERENADDCIKCDQGYFGEICDKCPNACGEQGCYGNGVCKEDCSAINVCWDKCLPGCKICNDTLGKCQECANNFMGENCETSCSDNCRSICSTQNCTSQCERDTGRCLHGCEPGSWGERCADLCSPRCLDQNCNQTSGQCVQCIRGYHGFKCHLPCVNCKDSGCLKTTGTCKKCDAGYYGRTCTQTCLNCSSDVCARLSGLCSNVSMTNIIGKNIKLHLLKLIFQTESQLFI